MNRTGLTYTVLFTFIVSFIFVTVLAVANAGTEEHVVLNQERAFQRAVLSAFGQVHEDDAAIEAAFASVSKEVIGDVELYRTRIDGEEAYAKYFVGSGLWGSIEGILAVNGSVTRSVGLEIITHNETPGLGGRIEEPWFASQFRNERIIENTISVGSAGTGDTDPDNGQIDAITGASRTSDSMAVILDTELSTLSALLGGNS